MADNTQKSRPDNTQKADWQEDVKNGLGNLKAIEEGLRKFTTTFEAQAGEYGNALQTLDDKVAEMRQIVDNSVGTIQHQIESCEDNAAVFKEAREAAEKWQSQAVEAKEELQKAVQAATDSFSGIAKTLAEIKEAYQALQKIQGEVVPALRQAAVAPQAPAVTSGEIAALRNDVAELKKMVGDLAGAVKTGGSPALAGRVDPKYFAEKYGESCKAILELALAQSLQALNGGADAP